MSDNKLTVRQQLKLSKQQLKASIESGEAKDRLIAMLREQLSNRDGHIESLQAIIHDQRSQLITIHQLADELEVTVKLLRTANTSLSEKLEQKDRMIADMQREMLADKKLLAKQVKELEKLDGLRHGKKMAARQLYGRKSEKSHQPHIFPELFGEGVSDEELAEAKDIFYKTGFAKLEKEPVPGLMAQGIPVKTTVVKLDVIPDGVRMIGTKTSRRLVYHKAWTEIHETIRYIYMREDKENIKFQNITEPLPVRPMKCKADTSVSVQLAVDRWLYHSPVKRTEGKLVQAGARLPYTTLLDWSNGVPKTLSTLHQLQIRELVKSGFLHCGETGLTVIDKSKKQGKKSHRGQILALMNPYLRIVAFKYMKGRGLDEIGQVLNGFKGILHTDGYAGYHKFGKQQGVIHSRCMVHTRRYFFNSKDTDEKRALHVLKHFINPLYAIERKCRADHLEFDEITEMRQKYAVPILDAFHAWMLEQQPKVKPHTPIAKAIEYALRLWDGLILYCSDGMILPDNNCLEREIRAIKLGKNAWMFAGSHEAAPHSPIMYSFFSTCKLQGVDPEEWLTDVLNRIATTPKEKLADLLPQHWKHRRLAAA